MESRMSGPWMTSTLASSVPTCATDMGGATMDIAGQSLCTINSGDRQLCFRNNVATVFSYRCDDGFSGTDCQPSSPLSSSVLSDFESQDALLATWQEVIGGEVVTPDMGCGVVSSGSSLYFSKVGINLCLDLKSKVKAILTNLLCVILANTTFQAWDLWQCFTQNSNL